MAGRILLVEDNADDAELTRLALERHRLGNRVVHLTDGAQALEYLFGPEGVANALEVRFIILDLKLPKVDGIQVLERLKADARTRAIPVVILSSSNQERDISRSYEVGVNSYVVKPVQLDEYMDRVSAVGRYWDTVNERLAAA
jgi:two-component system response regulator